MIDEIMMEARALALQAGAAIISIYNHSSTVNFISKQDHSPLTEADTISHAIIQGGLQKFGWPILSEEGIAMDYEQRRFWNYYWLVDPLDGTKEFLKKNGEFTVNIALMHGQAPVAGIVYAPALHRLYMNTTQKVWKEDQDDRTILLPKPRAQNLAHLQSALHLTAVASRSHRSTETETFLNQFSIQKILSMGSSLKFMLLADGEAQLYPRLAPTMEWDTAAAQAILQALDMTVVQFENGQPLTYNKSNLVNPWFIAY